MPRKWKAVKIQQTLIEEAEKEVAKNQFTDLAAFVSEAIQLRLQELAKGRVSKYLERDRKSRILTSKSELFYTPRHIWAQATSQKTVRIGITDYFQSQLREVVNVLTEEAGYEASKNEPFGVVEDWLSTHDLYSPLNGKIISVNKTVIDNPSTLNIDPYQWIAEVRPKRAEVNSWMDELLKLEGYEQLIAKIEGRPEHELTDTSRSSARQKEENNEEHIPKWRQIPVRKQLVAAAESALEKNQYNGLSEFVSEAVRLRLDQLRQNNQTVTKKQIEIPMIHERLLYDANHMWAMVTPEGNVRVGLSFYAQTRLKAIANIQIDPIGGEVKKEEPFGVVETWMFMFDLYSPISGRIISVNRALLEDPSIINEDRAHVNDVWIAEIKPNNLVGLEEELRDLMRPDQYKKWVSESSPPQILSL